MAEMRQIHTQEMEEIRAGLRETKAITESNARAIEAWSGRIADAEADSRAMAATGDQRLETAIADTVAMIADMGRQQQETDQRFEVFLQDSRADRQRFDQAMAANAAEHRAFTQNVQVLLAEISRLWQRVAG
ncbi:hypothetical protein C8B47_05585 [filamentous cyanobacterium CCP4]|nr:hypothetical protein C8B47_05585 [filamentous cyanobacterium CCP4]